MNYDKLEVILREQFSKLSTEQLLERVIDAEIEIRQLVEEIKGLKEDIEYYRDKADNGNRGW